MEKSAEGYFVEEIVIRHSIVMKKVFLWLLELHFLFLAFGFLRGSRARITSMKKMIETL